MGEKVRGEGDRAPPTDTHLCPGRAEFCCYGAHGGLNHSHKEETKKGSETLPTCAGETCAHGDESRPENPKDEGGLPPQARCDRIHEQLGDAEERTDDGCVCVCVCVCVFVGGR